MTIKHTKTEGIEPYLIETICLRLKEKEALSYLEVRGYSISRAQYYTVKDKVKQGAHTRLNHIATDEFLTQHIERIETLKTIHNELWNQYHVEKTPINKSKILCILQKYSNSWQHSMILLSG